MENESRWDTFTRTGRVSDYLSYAQNERSREGNTGWNHSTKEERGQREGTSNGNGAFGSYHW